MHLKNFDGDTALVPRVGTAALLPGTTPPVHGDYLRQLALEALANLSYRVSDASITEACRQGQGRSQGQPGSCQISPGR
jgi:hypothetical protein